MRGRSSSREEEWCTLIAITSFTKPAYGALTRALFVNRRRRGWKGVVVYYYNAFYIFLHVLAELLWRSKGRQRKRERLKEYSRYQREEEQWQEENMSLA